MLATFAAAALICAGSVLVGEAAARILGAERNRGWSPAVGLAILLAVAIGAVKLSDHGTTGAIVLALLIAVSGVVLWRRGGISAPPIHVVVLGAVTAAVACIPYLSNGRFGIVGFSFNNDLSSHIPWARSLANPDIVAASAPTSGYPIGPHSLVASLNSGTGIDVEWAFMGLLLVLPVLIAFTALALLEDLGPVRRTLGALLVSGAYTLSAFYAQAGFKELALTLFLLAMVAVARRAAASPVRDRRGAIAVGVQLGALGAGIVFTFSYGGLAWPILAALIWGGLELVLAFFGPPAGASVSARLRAKARRLRPVIPIVLATAGAGLLLLAIDAGRLIDSLTVFGSSPAGTGALASANIGHLAGPVPKDEIFGFWPREDFRFGIAQTFEHEVLSLLAAAVVILGGLWWLWRRDLAAPAAALASVALLVYLGETESPYTASKALAPAGALAMLLAVRPLLGAVWPRSSALRVVQVTAAVLFVGGAAWSSYLVLRGAQVGPLEHRDELAQLSSTIDEQQTLFLGHDDFARAELPGVPVLVQPAVRTEKAWVYGDPFDFDSVEPQDLDEFTYAIVPRGALQSEPPANFRRVRSTESYDLYRRSGTTPPRRILAEGGAPGAVLDCSTPQGQALARRNGRALVWPSRPIVQPLPQPPAGLLPGGSLSSEIPLPAGRWELGLQYTARQDVEVDADGRKLATLPAALDRPGPYWRMGTVRLDRPRAVPLRFDVAPDPLGADTHVTTLIKVGAVRTDVPRRLVPLSQACGRYVDWYVLNTAPSGAG